jgi:hypothetical protein
MKFILIFLISQSVLLPLLAGLIRWRRIDKGYQPFLLLLTIGFVTEIISFILIRGYRYGSNAIVINIYTLVEWTLIAWQFHVWGFLKQKKPLFYALLLFSAFFWMAENIIFRKINDFSPYFLFYYSFLIVLLSVNKINFMITHYNRNLFRNTQFVICLGFIVYFIYMIIYYWASNISAAPNAQNNNAIIFYLIAYVNALTNAIYAIAILLIPARVKFTLK